MFLSKKIKRVVTITEFQSILFNNQKIKRMSLYNSPKEHKLRKPRAGFEKIKQQQRADLNSPKEEMEMKPMFELSEQAKLRVKKKRQRSFLIQILVFTFILIPLTFVAVNFFYKKVETTHKKLAPHHYNIVPVPHLQKIQLYWKRAYTAFANKNYDKAIFNFQKLNKKSAVTTFGLTGLISTYDTLCNNGNIYYCDLLNQSMLRYKKFYTIINQDEKTFLREINNFTQLQIEKVLSE